MEHKRRKQSQLASATGGHGQGLGFRARAWGGRLPAAVAVGARVRSAAVVAAHGGGRRRRGRRLGFSRGRIWEVATDTPAGVWLGAAVRGAVVSIPKIPGASNTAGGEICDSN